MNRSEGGCHPETGECYCEPGFYGRTCEDSKYMYLKFKAPAPCMQSPFCSEGGLCTTMTLIAMLAGVFIFLVGPPKPDRLKDRGQTK